MEACCFNAEGPPPDRKGVMEALPDLARLSDAELKQLIEELEPRRTRSRTSAAAARQDRHPARRARRPLQKTGEERARPGRRRAAERDPRRQGRRLPSVSHVYCPECGFQNSESANYCSRCGALLVAEGADADDDAHLHARGRRGRAGRRGRGGVEGPALVVRSGGGRAGEVFRSRRADDDRPLARLRHLPRRRDRLPPHAVIARSGDAFAIEDLGSLNGTFLNRRRIEEGRARERRRGADRQVPAHLPGPMTTATEASNERRARLSRSAPSAGG